VVFNLMGLISVLACIGLPLELLAYVAAGALAAYWLPPRREGGRAAGQGAIAGLLAGLIGAFTRTLLTPLSLAVSGGSQALISQLPPESLQALTQAGLDPNLLFNAGTLAGVTALCCLPTGLLIGAGLGALGGLIFAAAKPE
jgi:hypothetical protein